MPRLKLKMGLSDADCQPRMNGCHELNVMYELRCRCKVREIVSVMHVEVMNGKRLELMSWMAGQEGSPRKQPQEPEEPHIENEEPINEDGHEYNEQPESEDEFTLEPIVVKAISDVVNRIMDDKLPVLIAKAMKDALKDKSEGIKENTKEDDVVIIGNKSGDSMSGKLKGCDYKSFRGCDPPVFDGKKDAVATCHWIYAMEAVISISECRVDQSVKFAAHSFVEEALHWWNTVKQSKAAADIEKMTWDDLKELVTKQFCPKNELDKVEREFLVLKAGSLNHRQYTSRFNEMARFVPHLVSTEERRVKLYMEGLPPKVRIHVKANAPKTFDSTVELSGVVWNDVMADEPLKEETEVKESSGTKRGRTDQPKRSGKKGKREETNQCNKCGKTHYGPCRLGTNLCFRCGKMGHFSSNCPSATRCFNCNRFGHLSKDCRQLRADASVSGKKDDKGKEKQKAKARAFTMTKDDAVVDPDVVTDGLSGKVKKIDRVFDVETTIGKMTRVTEAIDGCYVEIGGENRAQNGVRMLPESRNEEKTKIWPPWTRAGTFLQVRIIFLPAELRLKRVILLAPVYEGSCYSKTSGKYGVLYRYEPSIPIDGFKSPVKEQAEVL
ncbi:hypothetical protein E3N88_25722 [Mikania micrantha]|uniref:CCHC-type domain-containing protein n=1 Tax=Mikania micrantha TaxID=192012 RepID=A0A5N6N772_9ASTR|nr:hypothetical protein E3N88_25722 [Mikania micrantha]